MKASIIEIGLPTDNVSTVQPMLEQCLLDSDDVLIGYQVYEDQTLLVVRLLNDTLQYHLETLSSAFLTQMIDSFQVVSCCLYKVIFRDDEQPGALRGFPLRAGESWFMAADEKNVAYLCLIYSHLNQEQISWLAEQTAITQWTKEL